MALASVPCGILKIKTVCSTALRDCITGTGVCNYPIAIHGSNTGSKYSVCIYRRITRFNYIVTGIPITVERKEIVSAGVVAVGHRIVDCRGYIVVGFER